MKIKQFFILLFMFLFTNILTGNLNGQSLIPTGYKLDWTNAGLLDNTPTVADHIFNITNPNYDDNDDTDYDGEIEAALQDAINASGTSIIYFPQGSYTFHSTINLSVDDNANNIIFQGDGSNKTILNST